MQLKNSLSKYDSKLADEIEKTYLRLLTQYKCKNWQYFGNEVGQFNELIYRVIEKQTLGTFTSLSDRIPQFNNQVLQKWEQSSICKDETFKVIIPRVLFSMFCLRNKRGMVHKNEILPNEMDANILLANVKWILSELIRKSNNLDFDESQKLINDINSKDIDLLWNINGRLKVMGKINAKDKILILLYEKQSLNDSDLREMINYKNKTIFNNLLVSLDKESLIDYHNKICTISPLGIKYIEGFISSKKSNKP